MGPIKKIRMAVKKVLKPIFYYFEGKTLEELKVLCDIKSSSTITSWCMMIRKHTSWYVGNGILGGVGGQL